MRGDIKLSTVTWRNVCYSFQHQATPVLRTFDKEVQTLRQVTVESLISPRIESQMLASANQRTV
jgi:hypothetical protein